MGSSGSIQCPQDQYSARYPDQNRQSGDCCFYPWETPGKTNHMPNIFPWPVPPRAVLAARGMPEPRPEATPRGCTAEEWAACTLFVVCIAGE
ncbi:hypothetical protein PSPO01_04035 [Paraphaeosphaeria sporulosa]